MTDTTAAQLAALSPQEQRALLQQLLQKKRATQPPKTAVFSFGQERLWFLHQLDSGNAAYNLRTAVRLHGLLNIPALAQAVQEVVDRHEGLRTTIVENNGRFQQQIHPQLNAPLPITNLTNLDEAEREPAVSQQTDAEAQAPFDLIKGPLFRAKLLKLQADDHILLLTMHHIISDGWSIGILIREIATLYQTKLAGLPSPLLDLSVQYADFAAWQREWLQGKTLQKQLAYWREQLRETAVIDLPTDYPRPTVQTFAGARHYFTIAPNIANQIRHLIHAENATLFMGLIGAFNILLHIYSRQTDISVGTPVAGRNRNQLESVIGLFINTLVMRSKIGPQASFREFLKQIRQTALDAFAHQDVPFEKLVEELRLTRDPSRTPYFQHLFILQNAPMQTVNLPNLMLEPLQPNKASSLFDITLTMWDNEEGMRGYLEYNTDLFADASMAQFVTHFQQLLHQIGQQPDTPIAKLSVLTPSERSQILSEWNNTKRPFPTQTLTQYFSQQAQISPDSIAISASNGNLTYAQLDAQSSQLAAYLRQFDIQPDTLIGLALPRQTEMLVAILGILKAGAAYLPIDPTYPAQRIQYMLDHAQAPLLITNSALLDSLPPHQAKPILIDTNWPQIADAPPLTQDFSALNELAYVIYTSGSTGKPKGVQITHRNIANFLCSMQETFPLDSDDTLLAVTTLSFDIATLELYLPLLCGARVLLANQNTTKDATLLIELLNSEPVTMMQATPATWQMLLAAGWEGKQGLTILSGGEALPAMLGQKLLGCGTAVYNMYGPTETTVWSTCLRVTHAECQTEGSVAIGTPIGNTDVYILDDHHNPVPVGVTGNLYIGGTGVARGYLYRPDLTAERFPQHPFKSDQPIYFTGDMARYRRDGVIEFLGRSDHQVKIRGFRIELGEIENGLQQHNAITQAVVHPQGEQLVAYLITKGAEQPDTAALRTHLQESLPAYMIPHRFLFLNAYPLTPNGKVDRKALPKPDGTMSVATKAYTAPRNDIEEKLANIWQRLLNVPKVGVHDNFFELGGDSILAIRFIAQAKETGITFRANQLFQNQTVAELAVLADEQRPLSLTAVQTQHLTNKTEPMVLQLQATTPLDPHRLRQALDLMQQQLPNLQISFTQNPDGTWQQQAIDPAPSKLLEIIPLTHLSQKAAQAEAIQAAFRALKQRVDTPLPPHISASYLQLPQKDMLLLAMSPLVMDRAAIPHLLHALTHAYAQNQLPNLSQIRWQEWHSANQPQPNQTYWQTMAKQIVQLPSEHVEQAKRASTPLLRQRLPASITPKLQKVQDKYNMTLEEVVLTAVAQTLTQWQKSDHLWLTTAQYHRKAAVNGLNTRHTIGQLQNNLPLHLAAPSDDNADQWLQQTKRNVRQLPRITNDAMQWPKLPQISFVWQPAIPAIDTFMPLSLNAAHTMTTPLTIVAGQIGERLHVEWEYDATQFRHSTILGLSKRWQQNLDKLIAHTMQVEKRQLAPADFPEAQLDQAQLSQFLSKIGQKK